MDSEYTGRPRFPIKSTILAVVVFFIGLTVLGGSWYTVDQTHRGVLTRNGKVVGIAQPGLGFKMPLIDDVEKVSVKTHTWTWEKMESYSYDQQPAYMKVSVTLHANPEKVDALYSRFGTLDAYVKQRISPHVNQQVKVVFGGYTAARAIQSRGKLNSDMMSAITSSLGDDDLADIESIQLEDISFSKEYLHSVEQRMLAEVEVQRLQQNAEREKVQAQITVTKANAAADAVRADAQAQADAIRLRGSAEAAAIEARAKALAQNANLVTLVQAEKWDGKLPATMVPGGAVPMLTLPK
jgi:regulator of protease activity HflC (stomatin/prohibitin superfamily)